MNEAAKLRLQSIVSTKKSIDQTQAEKQQTAEDEALKKAAVRETAKKNWEAAISQIGEAIAFINAEIKETQIELVAESLKSKPDAALSQYAIHLTETGGARNCKAVLNVSALGLVQPVFLIPHTGKSPSKFQLEEADTEFYQDLLAGFIEQVLNLRQSKL